MHPVHPGAPGQTCMVARFLRTVKKFARPHLRLEAIGDDAGLAEEHSTAEIRQLVDALVRSYRQATTEAGSEEGTGAAGRKGGPTFRSFDTR